MKRASSMSFVDMAEKIEQIAGPLAGDGGLREARTGSDDLELVASAEGRKRRFSVMLELPRSNTELQLSDTVHHSSESAGSHPSTEGASSANQVPICVHSEAENELQMSREHRTPVHSAKRRRQHYHIPGSDHVGLAATRAYYARGVSASSTTSSGGVARVAGAGSMDEERISAKLGLPNSASVASSLMRSISQSSTSTTGTTSTTSSKHSSSSISVTTVTNMTSMDEHTFAYTNTRNTTCSSSTLSTRTRSSSASSTTTHVDVHHQLHLKMDVQIEQRVRTPLLAAGKDFSASSLVCESSEDASSDGDDALDIDTGAHMQRAARVEMQRDAYDDELSTHRGLKAMMSSDEEPFTDAYTDNYTDQYLEDDDGASTTTVSTHATAYSVMSLVGNQHANVSPLTLGTALPLCDFQHAIVSGMVADQFKELQTLTKNKEFFVKFGGFAYSHKRDENKEQNRHGIPCYDDNRVVLHERTGLTGVHNDYINASYIASVGQERRYIATQAPLESTMFKFWEMVVQERTHLIVCLADTNDSSQADQYWPTHKGDSLEYGDRIRVTLTLEESLEGNITHRVHTVAKLDPEHGFRVVTRTKVHQLHYHGWEDMTAPSNIQSIFHLMQHIENIEQDLADERRALGPIVVHCSAGVGRAGTFIAAHIACEHVVAVEEQQGVKLTEFNLAQLVYELRQQRPLMVYKPAQYEALHHIVHMFVTGSCC